ncbi:hypothetical protein Pta02_11450 [Planobispora takensis]|uniref:Uncharacterized protein n=1 Tax=Planobispora takensis TaxID=1367882 RepID=A0A8J3WTQ5_9ACTN|nr:hypothetical protein Pta02_11450 [Planobispora takensis]
MELSSSPLGRTRAPGKPARRTPLTAPPGVDRPLERVLDAVDVRSQVVGQLLAERGQTDLTAGPLEQRRTDQPLHLLDRLADAYRSEFQAFGGACGVQFAGGHQEHLDLLPFQHRGPRRRARLNVPSLITG